MSVLWPAKPVATTFLFFVVLHLLGGGITEVMAQDAGAPAAPDAEEAIDTLETQDWVGRLVFNVSATQVGHQNWVEGGVNSFAFNTRLDGEAGRASESWLKSYRMRLALGILKQEAEELQKAEDLIRLAAALQYDGEGFFTTFRPTASSELRTQFTAGYNYTDNPFEDDEREPPVKVSDFFSPAAFTQSLGLTYQPGDWGRSRLGIATRETIVALQRFRPLYSVPENEAVRFQIGVESNTEVDIEIVESVELRSKLNAFASFDEEYVPDVLWENELIMEVNEFLDVRIEGTALFDQNLSNRVQIKQVFSVGVSWSLI